MSVTNSLVVIVISMAVYSLSFHSHKAIILFLAFECRVTCCYGIVRDKILSVGRISTLSGYLDKLAVRGQAYGECINV